MCNCFVVARLLLRFCPRFSGGVVVDDDDDDDDNDFFHFAFLIFFGNLSVTNLA